MRGGWGRGGSGFWGELSKLGFLMENSGDLVLVRKVVR